MPRSGVNGTYTLPGAQKTQQPLTPIPSAVNNQGWEDVEQTFNTPTPIAYGGTNASTVSGAQQNLELEPGVDIPTIAQFNTLATKVDTRRNRIVNGDKLVSQENGQTSGTTNGRYISDQNAMFFVSNNGVFTGVNVAGRTSPAGGNRDRITITTADSALAAGEFLTYTQNIEGPNVGDLKWGTADAIPLIVRRGIRAPQGTWPVAFHNSAANRSYVTTFTVSAGQANTDLVHEFAIPGDTTGTWLNGDGVIGLTMDFVIGAGSTFQGVSGWQVGNMLTVSGATNGMGMAGAVFEFFDEGMKADPQSTGVYGQYEVGEVHPVYRSERYWWSNRMRLYCDVTSGGQYATQSEFPFEMCKTPAVVGTNVSNTRFGTTPSMSASSKLAVDIRGAATSGSAGFFITEFTANARLS